MKKIILVLMLVLLCSSALAVNWRTRLNPFTKARDYYLNYQNLGANLNLSGQNLTVYEISIENPPVQCPANTGMIFFNGTNSICTQAIGYWNRTGTNLTLANTGDNVGIGTTNPTALLHLESTTDITDSTVFKLKAPASVGVNNLDMLFQNTNANSAGRTARLVFRHGSYAAGVGGAGGLIVSGRDATAGGDNGKYNDAATSDSFMSFWTALNNVNAEYMRITSAGNVGIRTTSPKVELDVVGDILASVSVNIVNTNNTISYLMYDFLEAESINTGGDDVSDEATYGQMSADTGVVDALGGSNNISYNLGSVGRKNVTVFFRGFDRGMDGEQIYINISGNITNITSSCPYNTVATGDGHTWVNCGTYNLLQGNTNMIFEDTDGGGGDYWVIDVFLLTDDLTFTQPSNNATGSFTFSDNNTNIGITAEYDKIGLLGNVDVLKDLIVIGNVGIGNSSPNYKLSVDGSGYFDGNIYLNNKTISDVYCINFSNGDTMCGNSSLDVSINGSKYFSISTDGIRMFDDNGTLIAIFNDEERNNTARFEGSMMNNDNINDTSRFVERNLNNGSFASSALTVRNDIPYSASFGLTSSQFSFDKIGANVAGISSVAPGEMVFMNRYNYPFIWYINKQNDTSIENLSEVMRLDENGLNVTGNGSVNYLDYKTKAAKYHQNGFIDTPDTNWHNMTWNITVDTETTSGFTLVGNNTIQTDFDGIIEFDFCLHPKNNGAGGTEMGVFTRLIVDDIETRCSQGFDTQTRKSGYGSDLRVSGTVNVTIGSIVRLEYKVDNADLDFEGNSGFDRPVAATIELEKISDLNE